MIYINPYLSVPINTIIGGVAGSISTKSALATKLGISESIITRFQIVGSDVHCNISSAYNVVPNAFFNDTSITSYNDLDGICIFFEFSAFNGATNLTNVYAPNAVLGDLCFLNDTLLAQNEYLYNPYTIGGQSFRNTRVKKVIMPNVTTYTTDLFNGNTALIEVVGQPTYISSNCFRNTTSLQVLDVSKVTTMNGLFTFYASNLENYYFDELISLTSVAQAFRLAKFKIFKANKLVNLATKANMFQSATNATLIEMKSLKTFGDASLENSTFLALKTGCTIRVNIALATTNAGAADASLVWAKVNRASIVEFYDDAGNYVSTL